MTPVTAPAFTMADLRECVTGILLDLAALLRERADSYGCEDCRLGLADMCETHGTAYAEADRLERYAAMTAMAATPEGVRMLAEAAAGGGR